jgi:hypothetical protein
MGKLADLLADLTFHREETKETVNGNKVLRNLVIDTALPLILTGDPAKGNRPNHQYVPPSTDLHVFGDEVTVSGKLTLPGRNVVIFARALKAVADGNTPPAICVDGPELPEDTAHPKALELEHAPKNNPTKKRSGKVDEAAPAIMAA